MKKTPEEKITELEDYIDAVLRAVAMHCRGEHIPEKIASRCPHPADLLNKKRERDLYS
jgi:hypothetical protein